MGKKLFDVTFKVKQELLTNKTQLFEGNEDALITLTISRENIEAQKCNPHSKMMSLLEDDKNQTLKAAMKVSVTLFVMISQVQKKNKTAGKGGQIEMEKLALRGK